MKNLFCILALALLVGCSSTPSRIAYNTVAVPAVTVDHAMTAWGDYVGQGRATVADEMRVKAAFDKYQAAELVAIDAAQAYAALSSSGSTNNLDIAGALLRNTQASAAASQALGDLVNLIQTLGVKF